MSGTNSLNFCPIVTNLFIRLCVFFLLQMAPHLAPIPTFVKKMWPFHLPALLCSALSSIITPGCSFLRYHLFFFSTLSELLCHFYNSVGFFFSLCLNSCVKGSVSPVLVTVFTLLQYRMNKSKWPELYELQLNELWFHCTKILLDSSALFESTQICVSYCGWLKCNPITLVSDDSAKPWII